MSIILVTISKYLKEIFRNRGRVGILIIAPIIFFSFFGFIFITQSDSSITRSIGIVNDDLGYTTDISAILPTTFQNGSVNIVSLSNLYKDLMIWNPEILINTQISTNIIIYEEIDSMIDELETQSLDYGIYFPIDFTEAILSGYNTLVNQTVFQTSASPSLTVQTYGDPTNEPYQTADALITQTLREFISSIVGVETLLQSEPSGGYLEFQTSDVRSEAYSEVRFFIPGFIVFLVILQSITVAGMMAGERQNQTMERIKLSNMQSWELFAGITIGQMIAYTLQFVISAIVLFFWDLDLTIEEWLRAYFISQLTNINIIGISLIIAAFVKTGQDAMTVTGIGSAPLGFLSGSFLPVPEVWLVKSIGLQFWDLIPTYHATQALTDIIFYDATISDVQGFVIALLVYSIGLFILGIFLFQQRVIKGDK